MIKNHIFYNAFSDYRFKLVKAEGSFVWDERGHKFIDFTSGWNVANLGWNHPEVADAIAKQAKVNVYAPMWTADPIQEEYARELTNALPDELDAVCRATGGTEANEMALKIARATTERKKIIGFRDTYHGQSFGAMSIGYRPEYVRAISPMVPEFIQMQFPSTFVSRKSEEETLAEFLTLLEEQLKTKEVAAVVTEAGIITGWGSTLVAPNGFLQSVRTLTEKYGTLLILDEVGTGFSRCGKLFAMELSGVVPDILTLAKGICNGGAAIGATVVNSRSVGKVFGNTNITSTFGWTPVAAAAALTTLRVHRRDRVWENAKIHGEYMLKELQKRLLFHSKVGDVRGVGMEIGVMLVKTKKTNTPDDMLAQKVIAKAHQKGLHLVFGGEGNIQLMPPLTTPKEVLAEGMRILIEIVMKL